MHFGIRSLDDLLQGWMCWGKGPTVGRFGGVDVYQREGRRGDSYTLPIRQFFNVACLPSTSTKPWLAVVQ